MVTIDKHENFNAGLEYDKEKTRRQNLVEYTNLPEIHNLLLSTDAFIVKRNNGNSGSVPIKNS